MTEEEAVDKLTELENCTDVEIAHSEADKILCEFLNTMGFEKIVDWWEKIPKWYA